jgi:hypothetical protein
MQTATRRVLTLTCRMTRGHLHLLTNCLSTAETLWSITFALGLCRSLRKSFPRLAALGVCVEVLKNLMMLVQLMNSNGGLLADVSVLHLHCIRGSRLSLDAMASGLFGVSSPPPTETALSRAEKTKLEKCSM